MGRRYFLAALAWLALGLAQAPGQVRLEWQFKEGDTFWIEQEQSSRASITVRGFTIPQNTDQTVLVRMRVLKVAPDAFVLERTVEAVKATNAPSMLTKMAQLQEGVTFRATVDRATLKVTKLEGYGDFEDKLLKADPVQAPALRSVLPEEAFKDGIAADLSFLPPRPVKPGEQWARRLTLPAGGLGDLVTDVTHTYAGPTPEGHRITGAFKLSVTPPKPAAGPLPLQVSKAEMKDAEGSSTHVFDADRGRLVKAESRIKATINLTTGTGADAITLTSTLDLHVRQRVLDRRPEGGGK